MDVPIFFIQIVELLEDDGHLAANDRETPLPPLSADNRRPSKTTPPAVPNQNWSRSNSKSPSRSEELKYVVQGDPLHQNRDSLRLDSVIVFNQGYYGNYPLSARTSLCVESP